MSLKYLDIFVNAAGQIVSTDFHDETITQYSNTFVVRVLAVDNYWDTITLNILQPNGVTLTQKHAILQPQKVLNGEYVSVGGAYFASEYRLSQLDTSVVSGANSQLKFTFYLQKDNQITTTTQVSVNMESTVNTEVVIGDPTSLTNLADNLNDLSAEFLGLSEQFQEVIDTGELQGPPGEAATITVGNTLTGNPGTNAAVVNTGTQNDAILIFTIPRGNVGPTGPTGATGSQGPIGATPQLSVGAVFTGSPNSSAQVTISGTAANPVLNFSIPQGQTGLTGETGAAGEDGREVEFRQTSTHIQWKFIGETTWINLIPLSDITGPQGAAGFNGSDGREVELRTTASHIQWRYVGESTWNDLVALTTITGPKGDKGDTGEGFTIDEVYPTVAALLADTITLGHFGIVSTVDPADPDNGKLYLYSDSGWSYITDLSVQGIQGPAGEDGDEVELRVDSGFIQWKYVSSFTWTNLISLASLTGPTGEDGEQGPAGDDGREVELQKSDTHIQWRYVGDTTWLNLVSLVDITGPAGPAGSDASVTKENVEAVLTGTITSHNHDSMYYTETEVTTLLSGKANAVHTHTVSDITDLDYPVDSVNGKTGAVVLNAGDISYDNESSELTSTSVQGAVDELDAKKANINTLSSNINLYPTTADSEVVGYKRMVSSLDDPAYNTTAVDVPTGILSGTDILIASLAADPALFVGNPGVVNITTIGNIRKVAGNSSNFAEFFFRIYKRTVNGLETLLGTSDTTNYINPSTNNYSEFSAGAILNNGTFGESDRVVIKYFANAVGTASGYEFQFGGLSPVRTLLPVPVSVIVTEQDAEDVFVSTANFNGLLTGNEDTVQKALDKLDDHVHTQYLTAELDPVFNASAAKNIGPGDINNWNEAYGWGDHDGLYATLTGGKIDASVLPNLAITDTFIVQSEAQMLLLVAQKGDIAVRTDNNKSFILFQEPATEIGNWVELSAGGQVLSVNGQVGAVTLDADDVGASAIGHTHVTKEVSTPEVVITSNKTLTLIDAGTLQRGDNSNPITITIPNDSIVNFPLTTEIIVTKYGTGDITIVADSGVTFNYEGSPILANRYSAALLRKIAANEWMMVLPAVGIGAVNTVNGVSGNVVLDFEDVGAAPLVHTHTVADITDFPEFIAEETDPVFTASPAAGITSEKITNWDTAYGWGNHADENYLTSFTELDPVFTASPAASITNTKISNWDTAYSWGDHAGLYAELTNGKISSSVLPALAITDTFVVASLNAQLALNVEVGDIAIRTDINKSFILQSEPASIFENWKELLTPGLVSSVNGQTGTVVLDFEDVGAAPALHNHDNLYYTESETDTLLLGKLNTLDPRIENWDTAYGWGDHSEEGYLTSVNMSDINATGTPSSGTFLRGDGTWAEVEGGGSTPTGYQPKSTVVVSTSKTLAITDANTLQIIDSENSITLTVVLDASINFPVNTEIDVVIYGDGPVTINPSIGVTINGQLSITNYGDKLRLKKLSTNTWLSTISGITEESDPVFLASPAFGITSDKISNWDTAYSWGDHAEANYATQAQIGDINTILDNINGEVI